MELSSSGTPDDNTNRFRGGKEIFFVQGDQRIARVVHSVRRTSNRIDAAGAGKKPFRMETN